MRRSGPSRLSATHCFYKNDTARIQGADRVSDASIIDDQVHIAVQLRCAIGVLRACDVEADWNHAVAGFDTGRVPRGGLDPGGARVKKSLNEWPNPRFAAVTRATLSFCFISNSVI